MLTILKSERFQKEYTEFSSQIENITNESVKAELKGLLTQLVNEVRAIDAQAQEFMLGQKPVQASAETRNSISEIRMKITRKLSDYKETNPN